jgi:hypothetical protein
MFALKKGMFAITLIGNTGGFFHFVLTAQGAKTSDKNIPSSVLLEEEKDSLRGVFLLWVDPRSQSGTIYSHSVDMTHRRDHEPIPKPNSGIEVPAEKLEQQS